jgi:hypothetical protein
MTVLVRVAFHHDGLYDGIPTSNITESVFSVAPIPHPYLISYLES